MRWMIVGIAFSAVFVSQGVGAQEEINRELLLKEINQVRHDEAKLREAMQMGKDRTLLCSKCHGPDGNSITPGVPNLAGQNPTYLLDQIKKFADGRRKNFVMQALTKQFTTDDMVNLAIYFSSQTVRPQEADRERAAKGKQTFETTCQLCHGSDGKGEKGYARIAGQQVEYVKATLKRFRDNARGNRSEADMKRHDVRMEQMTQHLSDDDIENLAAYIALLP